MLVEARGEASGVCFEVMFVTVYEGMGNKDVLLSKVKQRKIHDNNKRIVEEKFQLW